MKKISQNIIETNQISITFDEKETYTSQTINIKDGTKVVPILGNCDGQGVLSFINYANISSKPLILKNKDNSKVTFEFNDPTISITLEVSILRDFVIHFKYSIKSKVNVKLSKIIANYAVLLGNEPDYTWVPYLRPSENYVMPDHVFRSPVIVFNKNKYSFSFIPDLKILADNRPFQTIMDLNLKAIDSHGNPQINFGFGNYKPVKHILFEHNPKKKMKIKPNSILEFGYFVRLYNGNSISEILKDVNSFLWQNHGRELLYKDCNPQVLSYNTCVDEGFKAIFERHKVWGTFKIEGKECGGFWHTSWMGKKKRKIHFIKASKYNYKKMTKGSIANIVSKDSILSKIIMHFSNDPFWMKRFDWFTRHFPVIARVAQVWNNAWFMNIRSGYSFRYFGELWKNQDLIDKGNRTLNLVISLPRTNGLFPTIVFPDSLESTEYSTIKGLKAFLYVNEFNTADASLAMYWALKFYQEFEPFEEIKMKSEELFNCILNLQMKNGAIPVYLHYDSDGKTPVIDEDIIDSASSGAPLMFLMEHYKITKNEKIIPIAKKIAKYIQTEIIPQDKWHDFEPFFSCTGFPLDYYDNYTKSHVMNALCIYWCAEGFKELYKATGEKEYLESGERIMAILSLFQQIWDLPYINFNTLGGFCSQNADAELSDARQGLFVRTYMEYYIETGNKEYMERGIAALRACWAMQLVSELEEQCPGNLEGIGTLDGVDRGSVVENYGHSGNDLRVPGYVMLDWGVGSSASATAYVKKHFGDLFIDFKENLAWGIDGLIVRKFEFKNGKITIDIDKITDKRYILIKARDPPDGEFEIILNGKSFGVKSADALDKGFII